MELALSLGDSPTPFTFLDKNPKLANNKDPLFSASLGSTFNTSKSLEDHQKNVSPQLELEDTRRTISTDPPFQLQLLPAAPVLHNRTSSKLHIPWLSDKRNIFTKFLFLLNILLLVCETNKSPLFELFLILMGFV